VDTGKRFGLIVKRRRESAHLSQETLAHRASLHRTYISLLERGLRTPSIDVLRKLAIGLETTMTSLVREFERAK
jgi:transcriptional regulator with XRE-family HTH domain